MREARSGAAGRPGAAVAVALAAAGGIHLAVIASHFRESVLFGSFFVVVTAMQLAQAALAAGRPSRRVFAAIAGTNAAVAAVWVLSRTAGLPLGPGAGSPEAAGISDSLSVVAEAVAVGGSLLLLRLAPGRRGARQSHGLLAGALVATVALSAGFAAATPEHHDHEGPHSVHQARGHVHLAGVHLGGIREPGDVDPGRDPSRSASSPIDGVPIHVGSQPVALVAGAGSVWVADRGDGTVTRIDQTTSDTMTIPVGPEPSGIAYGFGFLWVADYRSDSVWRIDPATNAVVGKPIPVGVGPNGIAAGPSGVWVTTVTEGDVQRIDPATLRAGPPIPVGFGPTSLVVTERGVWVTDTLDRTVVRVDPRTMLAGPPLPAAAGVLGIASGFGSVWATSASAGVLTRIDPASGSAVGAPIRVDDVSLPGLGPAAVATGATRVWVANNHDKTVVAVDPVSGRAGAPAYFDNRLGVDPGPVQIVEAGDALWVTNLERASVVRIPLNV